MDLHNVKKPSPQGLLKIKLSALNNTRVKSKKSSREKIIVDVHTQINHKPKKVADKVPALVVEINKTIQTPYG